jgi:hypothetical protein
MAARGLCIEADFTLYFTLFIVTFAKGSPLLTSFFPGMSEKMGFLEVITQYLSPTGVGSDARQGRVPQPSPACPEYPD